MSKILVTLDKFAAIVNKLELPEEKRSSTLDDLLRSALHLAMVKTLSAFPQITTELKNLENIDWQEFKKLTAEKNVFSPEFSERLDKEFEEVLFKYAAEITPALKPEQKAEIDKILQA